jgi:hypothetical protein
MTIVNFVCREALRSVPVCYWYPFPSLVRLNAIVRISMLVCARHKRSSALDTTE